ncbi:hypothetical protein [Teredinibacter franksiae]|uniref:hypothetical protein n=1 Tax=Teredinibacter franksiae TaxID=2761453 RepID=UPI001629D141|nr:hypothetical protein [Teredinibacter franksiae]
MDSIKRNFLPLVAAAAVVFVVWQLLTGDEPETPSVPPTKILESEPVTEPRAPAEGFANPMLPQQPKRPEQRPVAAKQTVANTQIEPVPEPESAEEFLLNISLEDDIEKRQALLFEALLLDPYNPLLNFLVIEHCLGYINSSQCGPEIFNALELLDAENAAVKDLKAVHAYQNGDVDGALEALKESLDMEVTDDYRWQRMDGISQVLSERGEIKDAAFIQKVLRLSSTREGLRFDGLNTMCREQQTNSDWRQLCLQRGTAMSKNSLSQNSKYVGYAIAASLSDNPEAEKNIIAGLNNQSEYIQGLNKQFDDITERNPDWQFSDREWEGYLRVYARDGEISATSYLLVKLREK